MLWFVGLFFALSKFIWFVYPYSSDLLHWHWGNHKFVEHSSPVEINVRYTIMMSKQSCFYIQFKCELFLFRIGNLQLEATAPKLSKKQSKKCKKLTGNTRRKSMLIALSMFTSWFLIKIWCFYLHYWCISISAKTWEVIILLCVHSSCAGKWIFCVH